MRIAHDDTGRRDLGDAFAVRVDEVGVRVVVGLQVLVVETRTLAELPVPRLECVGRGVVGHQRVDSCPDFLHLLVIAVSVGREERLPTECRWVIVHHLDHAVTNALTEVGPAVLDEILVGEPARLQDGEIHEPLVLPTRLQPPKPLRV